MQYNPNKDAKTNNIEPCVCQFLVSSYHNIIKRIDYIMPSSTDSPTIVGYSINDFYYENPSVCTSTNVNTNASACHNNKTAGETLKQVANNSSSGVARYKHSLELYNQELLRTINYLAGIGMIGAYIYVNTLM
jgi:hypothetical protein